MELKKEERKNENKKANTEGINKITRKRCNREVCNQARPK